MKLARALAFLTACVVALPVLALGQGPFFCRSMERVMSSCCCQHEGPSAHERDAGSPRLERAACCVRIEATTGSAALRPAAALLDAPLLVALGPAFEPVPTPAARALGSSHVQARAPPDTGPPLFIQNCSLLI
jgi:hypothetical protein